MIPESVKEELRVDDFMEKCCLCGKSPVQWHHNMNWANQSVQEKFAILPLCIFHHTNVWYKPFRYKMNKIMLERATEEDIMRYKGVFQAIANQNEY